MLRESKSVTGLLDCLRVSVFILINSNCLLVNVKDVFRVERKSLVTLSQNNIPIT